MIRCPDDACAHAFDVAMDREFSDPAYFAVHQLTVAAYRVEHPDGSSTNTLSVLHEVLRATLEDGLDGPALRRRIRYLGSQRREEPAEPPDRPPFPHPSGILAVADARDAAQHCTLVRDWAERVWRAIPAPARTGRSGRPER